MIKRAFGELEMAILNILKSGKRMTVKEVHTILGGEDKYNTIMTVMSRLAEKKVLAREKIGLQYEYWLTPNPQKAPSFFDKIKKMAFGVKTSAMVSYLIDSAENISEEEFEEMEKLLQEAKKKKLGH